MERSLVVLYGSQTGTSEDVAETVHQGARRRHFKSRAAPLDDFPLQELTSAPVAIFVCSTTGQGEEPDNMKKNWKRILNRNLPSDLLSELNFAVLGLGDSGYTKFNFAAKKLYRRLIQLGARPLIPLGLADDQHELGIDATVDPWLESLMDKLLTLFPLPTGLTPLPEHQLLPPKYRVTWRDPQPEFAKQAQICKDTLKAGYFGAKLISNDRLTPAAHFQDTRLICLDIEDSDLHYNPGDVAVILPENLAEIQDAFWTLFPTLEPDSYVELEPSEESNGPSGKGLVFSLRQCVRFWWDLQSTPKRSFFRLLSCFATDEMEREKLEELCSPAGQEELYSYCCRPRRTIVEALRDFPRTTPQISPDYLFELIPRIKPRSFSIASSQRAHGNVLQLLVAVVKFKTKLANERLGLCSNWLSRLPPGYPVPIQIRSGSIRFPISSAPCILIGPGTGVAPFRSFLSQSQFEETFNYLFFGCRSAKADFYFSEEWKRLVGAEKLFLRCAFSRDQDRKIYVQHLLAEEGKLLWKLVDEEKAFIFVAGSAKQMPKDVIESIKCIVQEHGKLTLEEADSYFANLEKCNRFQMETWS